MLLKKIKLNSFLLRSNMFYKSQMVKYGLMAILTDKQTKMYKCVMKQQCNLSKKRMGRDGLNVRLICIMREFATFLRISPSKMFTNMVICIFYGGCNITAGEPWDVSSEPMAS